MLDKEHTQRKFQVFVAESEIGRNRARTKTICENEIARTLIDPIFALLGWDVNDKTQYNSCDVIKSDDRLEDTALLIDGVSVAYLWTLKAGDLLTVAERRERSIDLTKKEKEVIMFAREKQRFPWIIITDSNTWLLLESSEGKICVEILDTQEPETAFDFLWELRREGSADELNDRLLKISQPISSEDFLNLLIQRFGGWQYKLAQHLLELNPALKELPIELKNASQRILTRLMALQYLYEKRILKSDNVLEWMASYYPKSLTSYRGDYPLARESMSLFDDLDARFETDVFSMGDGLCKFHRFPFASSEGENHREDIRIDDGTFHEILSQILGANLLSVTWSVWSGVVENLIAQNYVVTNGELTIISDESVKIDGTKPKTRARELLSDIKDASFLDDNSNLPLQQIKLLDSFGLIDCYNTLAAICRAINQQRDKDILESGKDAFSDELPLFAQAIAVKQHAPAIANYTGRLLASAFIEPNDQPIHELRLFILALRAIEEAASNVNSESETRLSVYPFSLAGTLQDHVG